MSISQQTLRHSSNSQPRVEACPCCGQAITTAQQALKIQQWIDGVRSEADRKAKELSDKKAQEQLARDREKIAAEAKATSQKEIAEFKRQNTELKRQKVEAEKKADAKTEAEVKRQRADWDKTRAKEKAADHKKTEEFKTTIEHLQRDLERLSAKQRGDGAEIDLVRELQAAFPGDGITGKSGPGGDAAQIFRDGGRDCGKVIFESKDEKDWKSKNVTKLREDRDRARADYAILCCSTFPSTAPDGAQIYRIEDKIVLVKPASVVELVRMLREMMIKFTISHTAPSERVRIHEKLFELITSEDGQRALHAIPNTISELQQIDSRQLTYTANYNQSRDKLYKAQMAVFAPFAVAVEAIISGDSQ